MKKDGEFRKMFKVCYIPVKSKVILSITVILAALIKVILAHIYRYSINNMLAFSTYKIIIVFAIAIILVFISGICLKIFETKKRVVTQEITFTLQKELLENKIKATLLSNENEQSGEWSTKICSDCKILSNFFPGTVLGFAKGLAPFIFSILFGLFFSYKLTIVIIVCSVLAALIPKFFAEKLEEKQEEKQVNDESVRDYLIDCLEKVALVKAYRANDFFVEKFVENYDRYSEAAIENTKVSAKIESVNIGIGFLMNTIWMIVGVFMIMDNSLDIGTFVGLMALSDCFNWPFFEMPMLINDYLKEKVSYNRLYMDSKYGEQEGSHMQIFSIDKVAYQLKNVYFKYGTEMGNVIRDLSIEIDGGLNAIVGESGKGKTTLLKLLSGLYHPSEGVVALTIGGEIYTGSEISKHICYVTQKNYIFTDTVFENVRLGKENATKEEVENAAKLAGADEFIKKLPQGYDTIIGDNSDMQLSVGQRQRISLARGILRNAEIYLLDEVTSGLDAVNQQVVVSNFLKLNRPIILVTHNKEMLDNNYRIIEI